MSIFRVGEVVPLPGNRHFASVTVVAVLPPSSVRVMAPDGTAWEMDDLRLWEMLRGVLPRCDYSLLPRL